MRENDAGLKILHIPTQSGYSNQKITVQKHLFSGNSDLKLAIPKIQVLAKPTAKGILGSKKTPRLIQ